MLYELLTLFVRVRYPSLVTYGRVEDTDGLFQGTFPVPVWSD